MSGPFPVAVRAGIGTSPGDCVRMTTAFSLVAGVLANFIAILLFRLLIVRTATRGGGDKGDILKVAGSHSALRSKADLVWFGYPNDQNSPGNPSHIANPLPTSCLSPSPLDEEQS